MKNHAAAILSTLAVTGTFAAAQPLAPVSLPEAHTHGSITWITGGIGHDEAKALERQAKHFPLELVFVQKKGRRNEFLADIPLTIRDAGHHVVFEGRAEGPLFLAKLPEGSYQVTAKWEDWRFSKRVHVGDKPQRVVFEWKKTDWHGGHAQA
jgi:hypothetical protein